MNRESNKVDESRHALYGRFGTFALIGNRIYNAAYILYLYTNLLKSLQKGS